MRKLNNKKQEISKLEVGNEKTRTKKREISKLEVGNENTQNWKWKWVMDMALLGHRTQLHTRLNSDVGGTMH